MDSIHAQMASGQGDKNDTAQIRSLEEEDGQDARGLRELLHVQFLLQLRLLCPITPFRALLPCLQCITEKNVNTRRIGGLAVIAIKEFAPFNLIYYLGNKYYVNSISINVEKEGFEEKKIYICDKCNEIVVDAENKEASTLVSCPSCKEQVKLNAFKKAIKFPNMFSQANDRITCDEENREITGYDISINYQRKEPNIDNYAMTCENCEPIAITYEHNGEIFMVNKGVLVKDKKTLEIETRTFNFCSACGSWLSTAEKVQDHVENCSKGGSSRFMFEDLWLFVRGNHRYHHVYFTLGRRY